MTTERRSGERFSMSLPIRMEHGGIGFTVDISVSGVAFLTDVALEPGSVVHFSMTLNEKSGPLQLHCGGVVVRVEPRGRSRFAAVAIEDLAVGSTSEH
jgi:hypothetical protein